MLLVALQGILILLTAIASPTTEALNATTAAPVFNVTTAAPMGLNVTTAAPVTPGVNVTAAPTTPEVNVTIAPTTLDVNATTKPYTPKVNGTAIAPTTLDVNATTKPNTPKVNGTAIAPTTLDVNATTKPNTPNVNGTSTPMTLATTEITTPKTKKPNSTTEIPQSTTPKTKKPKSTTEIPQSTTPKTKKPKSTTEIPESTTSKPPKKAKKTSRLTNIDTEIKIDLPEAEINEILNKTSPGRKIFEIEFKQTIRKVFKDKDQDTEEIIIKNIRRGSIIVEYTIVLNGSSPEEVKQAVNTIQEQIKSGKVGNFTVNKDHSTNTKITVSADQFNACEPMKTEPDQKLLILLSVAVGVLGLLVIVFVILICVLCKQRKAFKENL